MSKFWSFKNISESAAELRVDGEIIDDGGAWLYEWFGIPAASPNAFRDALAQHAGKDLTIWVDSWGGDVVAAMGIYNALMEHKAKYKSKITAKIDGKAVSAGTIIPMAADEILVSPGSMTMTHNPWTVTQGESKDMIKAAERLAEVKEAIINVYQTKTKLSRDKLAQMMDEETWMSAQKAVSEGFADGILYSDPSTEPVQNSYSFSRIAIMNSSDAAMRRFFDQWKAINKPNPPAQNQPKESEPEVDINSVEDLKKEYPDFCNQIATAAASAASTAERERIKEIDSISATISSELVNKAKYDEPMSAEKLALNALRQDAERGVQHLNNRQEELTPNNGVKSDPDPANNAKKEQEDALMNSIAASANRGRKKEGN